MRLYLDTNILFFLLTRRSDEIDADISSLIKDDTSILLTSTVCVHELIHLYQIGKLPKIDKKNKKEQATAIFSQLDEIGIDVIPVTHNHLQEYAMLPLHENHRDPNDRLIIAQAISDKIRLVSSDRKFEQYRRYGLDFTFNKR